MLLNGEALFLLGCSIVAQTMAVSRCQHVSVVLPHPCNLAVSARSVPDPWTCTLWILQAFHSVILQEVTEPEIERALEPARKKQKAEDIGSSSLHIVRCIPLDAA